MDEKLKLNNDSQTDSVGLKISETDEMLIGNCVHDFYHIFSNNIRQPDFDKIHEVCSLSASIIKKSTECTEVYDLKAFIDPRKKILTDGTLTEFSEWETGEETRITGNIAQRYSTYRKKACFAGNILKLRAVKCFSLSKKAASGRLYM
uniref:Uncharacterized protein n=1 Tax=Chryseobacterium endophyticum TaxID=1854762 RepID=A0AAU6WN33_9FLAO